jgi:glycosyltransferase involved in cell wall biosynthesis
MSRLKIAFVNAEDPWLARTGYLLLTQQIIATLGRNHDVNIIVFNGAEIRATGTDTLVLNRRPKDSGKRISQALSAFSRESMVVHQTRFPGCAEALAAALEKMQPDIVVLNHIRSAWLAPEIRHLGFKTIYIAHNAEGATAHSVAGMQRFGLMRFFFAQEARKVEELEARVMRAVDHVVTLTGEDATRVGPLAPETPITVIPPAVEIQKCATVSPWNDVLLLGSFRWLPKRINAIWLAKEVMPRVRTKQPDAMLRIVGTEAMRLQSALSGCAGVTIHENVPSVQEYYASAAVVAVPERQAGGIKLKTLEAASFGKAIVTTPAGREGTGLSDEIHCLVAETADEFAARILEFLEDHYLRQSCGAAARSHVAASFAPDTIEKSYDDVLQSLVPGDGRDCTFSSMLSEILFAEK